MESTNRENQDYNGTYILENHESYLESYNKYIVQLLTCKSRRFASTDKILDFGAGIGTLAKIFNKQFQTSPYLVEIDNSLINKLKADGFKVKKNIEEYSFSFDFIYTSNVLEHIRDDQEQLMKIYSKMTAGAQLAIFVPAFPILFTDLDSEVGHFRRYRKKEIEAKVKSAGLRLIHSSYADSFGFFVLLITKFLTGKKILRFNNNKNLTLYNNWILPLSKFFDKLLLKKFIGKNLLVIAVKD